MKEIAIRLFLIVCVCYGELFFLENYLNFSRDFAAGASLKMAIVLIVWKMKNYKIKW